jgi:GNAT superfamily N-acetyltransferase
VAAAGRIHVHPADFHLAWLTLAVLPAFRRLGTGTALFAAASEHAREMGKDGFQLEIDQTSADGLDFLGRRGFRETGRSRMVERDLRDIRDLGDLGDIRPQDPAAISGIRFTTLADEPGLLQGVHQVAVAAFPDIPIGGDPWVAGELDEFRARDVDRPGIPLDAFMIAVEEGSGRPVGYASLQYLPGSRRRAWHDMTGVLPEFRGRRIATALKLRTIRWAVDAGLDALITGNDVENAPMRAINARLGYRPLPDRIELRGPLAEAAPIVRF